MEATKIASALGGVSRGLLIVFEGLDKSGKSTQVGLLMKQLETSKVDSLRLDFPDRSTEIGQLINRVLSKQLKLPSQSEHLLFSANRWERNGLILESLTQKRTVVLDRYAYSGVAYTAAKGEKDREELKNPDRGLVRPDMVFYLYIDPEVAQLRGDYGKEVYEKVEFQKKVDSNFRSIEEGWVVLDASKPAELLHEEIVGHIETFCLKNPTLAPPGLLWK